MDDSDNSKYQTKIFASGGVIYFESGGTSPGLSFQLDGVILDDTVKFDVATAVEAATSYFDGEARVFEKGNFTLRIEPSSVTPYSVVLSRWLPGARVEFSRSESERIAEESVKLGENQ